MKVVFAICALVLSALSWAQAPREERPAPELPEPSALGRQVLERIKPSVVQLKTFFEDSRDKFAHGTGFVVGEKGLAITNYHVISSLILDPQKYRLEYRTASQKTGKVEVLAIDVLHDLALVRLVGFDAPALQVEPTAPQKGDRAYAVGFPLDVGLTITEGVSNGLVEDSFTERLHYAGPINGGMSGGPALDAQGRVIGVNVSVYFLSQSVAFLVPAKYATALIENAAAAPFKLVDGKKELSRQLRSHANSLFTAIPKNLPTQSVRGVQLPAQLAPFFDCGSSGSTNPDSAVLQQRTNCSAKSSVYVNSRLFAGEINFSHVRTRTTKLGAFRFSNHMDQTRSRLPPFFQRGNRREQAAPSCTQKVVRNNDVDLMAEWCTRAYKRLEGLYDFSLHLTSSHKGRESFSSDLDLTAVPYELGLEFMKRYMASIKLDGAGVGQ